MKSILGSAGHRGSDGRVQAAGRAIRFAALGAAAVFALAGCASGGTSGSPSTNPSSGAQFAADVPSDWQGRDIQFGQHIYPAWTTADASGNINGGVLYELGKAIAQYSGQNVVQSSGDLDTFISSLQSGRMDVVGVTGASKEREATYDIIAFYVDGPALLGLASGSFAPAQTSDMCGHTIAYIDGGTQSTQIPVVDQACTAAGKSATTHLTLPDANSALLAVQSGRAEAFFTSRSATEATAHSNNQFKSFSLSDASTLPSGTAYDGVMVRKGGGEAQFVLKVVQALYANGQLAQILSANGLSAPSADNIGINLATARG